MCDEKQNECRDHGDPPWEGPQVIPAQIRWVDNLIFRKINQFARANGVEQATPMHGWIIEYLYRHREEQVFQRDIEREFSITRSTVTNILQLMERKGYIQRQSVPQDARLKQLVLTEEGVRFHENTILSFHQTDDYVANLLTEEENAELRQQIAKMEAQIRQAQDDSEENACALAIFSGRIILLCICVESSRLARPSITQECSTLVKTPKRCL